MKTAESNIIDQSSFDELDSVVPGPAGAELITIDDLRETQPELWQTALDSDSTVERGGRDDLFLVSSDESADWINNCSLIRVTAVDGHEDQYSGWCSCEAFQDEGVCHHLVAIRQFAAIGGVSIPDTTS